jgi:hypothetical protein
VPELAREAPFTSKDIDFCGDHRAVRLCADRLGGTARLATFAVLDAGLDIDDVGEDFPSEVTALSRAASRQEPEHRVP